MVISLRGEDRGKGTYFRLASNATCKVVARLQGPAPSGMNCPSLNSESQSVGKKMEAKAHSPLIQRFQYSPRGFRCLSSRTNSTRACLVCVSLIMMSLVEWLLQGGRVLRAQPAVLQMSLNWTLSFSTQKSSGESLTLNFRLFGQKWPRVVRSLKNEAQRHLPGSMSSACRYLCLSRDVSVSEGSRCFPLEWTLLF